MTLNREFLELDTTRPENWNWREEQALCRRWAEEYMDYAEQNRVYVVTGGFSLDHDAYDLRCQKRVYNSAFVFGPDGDLPERYDKVHVVLFGETVPFRFGRLRFLYLWLNRMTPWGGPFRDYSLFAGDTFRTFSMTARDGREFRFGIPICYEDVMPYITRRFVTGRGAGAAPRVREGKQIDFILNISNDGWFAHSTELPQHLAISAFRAVENRIGVARAVNTGISAFIDSDGRIHHVVEVGGRRRGPGVDGYQVAHVCVDSRYSVYSRLGDVFAWLCAGIWVALALDYVVARIRGRPASPSVVAS
jgi:apolipoprotein N-acyltransferase